MHYWKMKQKCGQKHNELIITNNVSKKIAYFHAMKQPNALAPQKIRLCPKIYFCSPVFFFGTS